MAFTDLMASDTSHMPFVTCMLGAPVLSRSQLPYTVSFHSLRFCQAPPPFTHVQINPDAHNVCTRAKTTMIRNRFIDSSVFTSDMAGTEDTPDSENEFQSRFQQAHERQASRMYFLRVSGSRQ
jgi:hypothetical protein